MSLVSWMRSKANSILFVAISVSHIELGVMDSGVWRKASLHRIPIVPPPGGDSALTGVTKALERAESLLPALVNPTGSVSSRVGTVRVLVADAWLAAASMPWNSALRQEATADVYAREQLFAAGVDLDEADIVRIDDAPYGQPRQVVVYPAGLLADLSHMAMCIGAQLDAVLPLSSVVWKLLPKWGSSGIRALALLDHGFVLIAYGAGRLTDVTVRVNMGEGVDGVSEKQFLRELWQRMRLRHPQLNRVERLAVLNTLDGKTIESGASSEWIKLEPPPLPEAPAELSDGCLRLAALVKAEKQPLNPVAAGFRIRPLHLVTMVIALWISGILMLQAWQTTERAQSLISQFDNRITSGRTVSPPPSWTPEEKGRIRAVNGAIREMNLPIAGILRALQPPRESHVVVLSVDVLGAATNADDSAGIKVIAETPTGAEMASYVEYVSERKPFSMAYLTRHEIVDSLPGHPYRFTLEAIWTN